jgi:hypothetical protein
MFMENIESGINAIVMPVKARVNAFVNAVNENSNVIIACDENENVLGITALNAASEKESQEPETMPETVKAENDNNCDIPENVKKAINAAVIAINERIEQERKEKKNVSSVLSFIKKHAVRPVTIENLEKDDNYKQMVHVLHDKYLLNEFIGLYRHTYSMLYDRPDYERENYYFMDIAESFMKDNYMHITVSAAMKDLIVSDRELIAYAMTLKMFSFNLERYGYRPPMPDIVKLQGIELDRVTIEQKIADHQYLLKGHCVYMIERTKNGYKTRKLYKSNECVPLVKPGTFAFADRDYAERLINRSLIPYPA